MRKALREQFSALAIWAVIFSLVLPPPAVAARGKSLRDSAASACRGAQRALAKGVNRVREHFQPDWILNADAYEALKDRKVSDYFPEGKVTEEARKRFFGDFDRVMNNFSRMYLRGVEPAQYKEMKARWEDIKHELLNNGLAQGKGERTLEQLLLERLFAQNRPPDFVPLPIVLRDKALHLVHPKTLVMFPVQGAIRVGKSLKDQFTWGWRLAVVGALFGAAFSMFVDPVSHLIKKEMYRHFGWAAVKEQMALARLEQWFELRREMEDTREKMKDVARKYQMEEISREEAQRLWKEFEKVWLEQTLAVRSMVPDNFKEGRNLYREANMAFNVNFANLVSAVNNEILNYEMLINNHTDKLKRNDLAAEERERVSRELEEYRVGLEHAKTRIGTAVAMVRVYEMMFPEYNRAEFMDGAPGASKLVGSYDVFMDGFRFQYFADRYFEQMDAIFKELGINTLPLERPLSDLP